MSFMMHIYIIADPLLAQVGSIIPHSMGGLMRSHKTKQTLILIYIYKYFKASGVSNTCLQVWWRVE
jgi:hypothetical protein